MRLDMVGLQATRLPVFHRAQSGRHRLACRRARRQALATVRPLAGGLVADMNPFGTTNEKAEEAEKLWLNRFVTKAMPCTVHNL